MSKKQAQEISPDEVEKTPNYALWIVGTMLVVAGFVFIKRNLSSKEKSKKVRVYTGAADYLYQRQQQVRKPNR